MSAQEALVDRLEAEFRARYRSEPRVFFAPGRVNLIGAHLDYNGGAVLPVPLLRGTYVAVAPGRQVSRFMSLDLAGRFEVVATPAPAAADLGWAAYSFGVWLEGRARGHRVEPVDVLVAGDLPRCSGLSSSASLEVASGFAFATLFGWDLGAQEIAEIGWTAETAYVGVKCGIMDQFASALAKAGHALYLECGTRRWRHLPLGACDLVVLDTRKPRELVDSKFNERVEQCLGALRVLQRQRPGIPHLAGFSVDDVEAARTALGETFYRRARHVTSESERMREAVAALESSDLTTLGALIRQSHASAAVDYGVSCPELDFLVGAVCTVDGVLGARLTGAGFGGCVLALARPGALAADESAAIAASYEARFGLRPEILDLRIGDGPQEVGTARR